MQESLFKIEDQYRPLSDLMRPDNLDDYVGQKHLLADGSILKEMIKNDKISSMIFWGPPGVGKTTLAKIIAKNTSSSFITFSAVTSSIKEIKEVMYEADKRLEIGQRTILFIDEIHRFNKAQQDAFLPYIEKGSIILIGATTENPSFEINNALLSRCKVFILNSLDNDNLKQLLIRAINKAYTKYNIIYDDEILDAIINYCSGDARVCLSTLELLINNSKMDGNKIVLDKNLLINILNKKTLKYDKNSDEHYNIISALHKSMRNSDVDASIYWLSRMLEGGEDPLYIARRLVRFASEDIGMADSRALEITTAAFSACQFLGMPECDVHLTHAVTYLALAPKSNALYIAYNTAKETAIKTANLNVPLHLRNAPNKLLENIGYAKGYEYSQDYKEKMTDMICLPEVIKNLTFYHPSNQGSEIKVKERMRQIKQIKLNYSKYKTEENK